MIVKPKAGAVRNTQVQLPLWWGHRLDLPQLPYWAGSLARKRGRTVCGLATAQMAEDTTGCQPGLSVTAGHTRSSFKATASQRF